jgi:hypothetical protein
VEEGVVARAVFSGRRDLGPKKKEVSTRRRCGCACCQLLIAIVIQLLVSNLGRLLISALAHVGKDGRTEGLHIKEKGFAHERRCVQ